MTLIQKYRKVHKMFEFSFGIQNSETFLKKITREAVRAVIIRDNQLLMIHTNKGDYKFPGGGINPEERMEDALIREVEEESGYKVHKVGERIGNIIESHRDQFVEDAIFEMKSSYYLCEISDEYMGQHLDPYEEEQEFKVAWISMEEAICNNEKLLEQSEDRNSWVLRETMALKEIKRRRIV